MIDREAVRLCLTKAGLPVQRKNASQAHEDPELILTSCTEGVFITCVQRFGQVPDPTKNAMVAKTNLALQAAGFTVSPQSWDTLVVTGHA
jgi:hypothetical protein